ncbi:hypothetical protein N7507_002207 [Penicillium longicatenatum]|nr:hypothetical protein N7507_002207 [Penicillium longicatenatum]
MVTATTEYVTYTDSGSLPLTTTFKPPSTCLKHIATSDYSTNSKNGDVYFHFHLGNYSATECYPSGWNPTSFYSPGVCPEGYEVVTSSLNIIDTLTQTQARCCPSGFWPATESSNWQSSEPCSSTWLKTDTKTITTHGTTSISYSSGWWGLDAYAVSIEWMSTDFKTSTPTEATETGTMSTANVIGESSAASTSTSSASSSGLSSGAKAGVGAGVSCGAIVIALLIFGFLVLRRKRQRKNGVQHMPGVSTEARDPPAEMPTKADTHAELPANLVNWRRPVSELPAHQ